MIEEIGEYIRSFCESSARFIDDNTKLIYIVSSVLSTIFLLFLFLPYDNFDGSVSEWLSIFIGLPLCGFILGWMLLVVYGIILLIMQGFAYCIKNPQKAFGYYFLGALLYSTVFIVIIFAIRMFFMWFLYGGPE